MQRAFLSSVSQADVDPVKWRCGAKDLPDRDGRIGRPAWGAVDEGASAAVWRRYSLRRRWRPCDGTRGAQVAVSDLAAVDRGFFGRRPTASEAAAFDQRNGQCGDPR